MSSLDLLSLSLSAASINNVRDLAEFGTIVLSRSRLDQVAVPLSYSASSQRAIRPVTFMKFNTDERH